VIIGLPERSQVMSDPLHHVVDPRDLRAGDYVTVAGDSSTDFAVVKILVTDAEGVHTRLYQERFDRRPVEVDPESLTLGPVIPSDGVPLSMHHAPFSYSTFSKWEVVLPARGGTVGEPELAGSRCWQEAAGGYH
jgi:hypothetical protein